MNCIGCRRTVKCIEQGREAPLEEFWRFYYDITVFCPAETFFLGANKTLFSGFLVDISQSTTTKANSKLTNYCQHAFVDVSLLFLLFSKQTLVYRPESNVTRLRNRLRFVQRCDRNHPVGRWRGMGNVHKVTGKSPYIVSFQSVVCPNLVPIKMSEEVRYMTRFRTPYWKKALTNSYLSSLHVVTCIQ